jgi:hypothetical protein
MLIFEMRQEKRRGKKRKKVIDKYSGFVDQDKVKKLPYF